MTYSARQTGLRKMLHVLLKCEMPQVGFHLGVNPLRAQGLPSGIIIGYYRPSIQTPSKKINVKDLF